ncbi:MAG: hypothetical protein AB3N09_08065 [Tateyamaria sp.]
MLNSHILLSCVLLCAGLTVHAQQDNGAPLSVIDWLDQQSATPVAQPAPDEPDVTTTANVPAVTVAPLQGSTPKRVGLAPSSVTGLPDDIWSGSQGGTLARAIATLPDAPLPALQSLIVTLLLAEANPPKGATSAFDLARVDALTRFGALDPALALLEQSGVDQSPAHFKRFMDLSLISGTEGGACAILSDTPAPSPGRAHDVFCAARAGDWDDAVLILGTARALGLLDPHRVDALERFLDPDLFEGEAPLTVPATPDPLAFRLFEAIGTPIPTRGWPVIYANADLATTAGWKAQLEAAERLAQRGTLGDNRLLGLYTQRQAAASGGVWDRVAAVQRFETALRTGSTSAVSKTLPDAWRAVQAVRLETVFASLFADRLGQLALSGPIADLAFDIILLSPEYEAAPTLLPARALKRPAHTAIATGTVPAGLVADGIEGAVLSAFATAAPNAQTIAKAQGGALGAALVDAIVQTHEGSAGDVSDLATGLATLRALGLEDVARRVGLQVLLLDNRA